MRLSAKLGCLTCLVLSCTSAFAEESTSPLLKALFANPAYSSPALSEDGETLAVIGSKGDEQIIITRPVAGGPLTGIAKQSDPERRVAWLEWANSRRLLMSVHGRNPNGVGMRSRAAYLFGVDADGKNFGWLGKRWPTFGQGDLPIVFQDRVIHWTPSDPETVLIQIRPPYRQDGARVMKMNVDSGALTPVAPAEKDIEDWYADQKGNVRAGMAYKSGNTEELWTRIDPKAAFDLAFRSDTVKPEMTFLDFHAEDPTKIYVLKNLDGRNALYEFDLREKKLGALVFSRPDVDLDGIVRSSDDAKVIGILYRTDSPQIKFLDAKAEHEYASIQSALEREFGQAVQVDPVSQSRDGNRQVLKVSSDTQPPTYFLYDRALKNLFPLIEGRPGIKREQLSPTKRVNFVARDGLPIPAYLTLPRGHEPKHLPLIALVHGGPMARDMIEWDPEVQLFASRGFAVLQVNFRGSTGLGAKYRDAGYREWGQKIQDDITDGVKWAVAEGFADPDRLGIYGGSYGGYAALVGVTKTADLYRAGAAYAAVTDIELMLSDDEWYDWKSKWHETLVGGESGDAERLRASSPLRHVANVHVPVLLGHGSDDERVHVRQSQLMAKALKDAGKDVTYIEFPNEIHGFTLEASRIRWYESLIAFFEKNLAPRSEMRALAPRS